jgi:hypothetical protein
MAAAPLGEINRLKFLMEAADLPMITRRYEDGTVVQIQRIDEENIVRVWPGIVTNISALNIILILSSRRGVYTYHTLDLDTGNLSTLSDGGTIPAEYDPLPDHALVEQNATSVSSSPYYFNGNFSVEKVYDSEEFPTYQAYALDGTVIWSRTCSGGGDGAWDWSETFAPLMINGFSYSGFTATHHLIAAKQYYPWRYVFSNVLHSAYSMRVLYNVSDSYTLFMTFKNVGEGNILRVNYGYTSGGHTWERVLDVAESTYLSGIMDVFPPSQWTPMTLDQFQSENSISFAPKGTGNDSYFNTLAHIPHLNYAFSGNLISENISSPSSITSPPWSGIFSESGLVFVDGLQGTRKIHLGDTSNLYNDPRTLPIHQELTSTFKDCDTLEFSFWRRKA